MVKNLSCIASVIMRKKKLRASDRLKTSASHVTQVQSCNTSANYKKRAHAWLLDFLGRSKTLQITRHQLVICKLFSCSPKILSGFFNNDNRTEWSSILSVITSMITNRIVLHKVLLSVNHNHNNFRKKRINLGQTSPLEKFYSCCCL